MTTDGIGAAPDRPTTSARTSSWLPRRAHPYAWATLGVTWVIWVFNAMDFALVQVLGPVIVREFRITGLVYGSILAVMFLMRAVVDLPLSALSDRVGSGWRRKLVWTPVVVFYALISSITALRELSGTLVSFFLLRGLVNLGGVACETLGITATSEWWARSQRGFAVGLHHTGFPIGILLAGQLAALVLSLSGDQHWRDVFWFSLLSLPFVALYWWLATPARQKAVYDRISNNGLVPPQSRLERVAVHGRWTDALNKEVVLASLYVGLFIAVFFCFLTAFPLYLAFVGGYSFAQVASYSVIWTISGAFFQVVLPSLSDRIGRKPILVAGGIYAAIIMLLLPYVHSVYTVFAVQILFGVVTNSVYPICFSVCADAAPEGRTATAVSISLVTLWVFSSLATFLTGVFLQAGGGLTSVTGYRILFDAMSAVSLVAGIMYLFAGETASSRGRTEEVVR